MNTYNNTPHSALLKNMTPNSVNLENSHILWESRENNSSPPPPPPASNIHIGDYCRISRDSGGPFTNKNFDQNWSEEVFRVVGIDKRDVPIMYMLQDTNGEDIVGKFYKQEIQVIGTAPPKNYRIEKIIRSKGSGKHKQYLVKWYGYRNEPPSWIPASNIIKNE